MPRARAVIVHDDGTIALANGGSPATGASVTYDLDHALQRGGRIVGDVIPLGLRSGSAILMQIEEADADQPFAEKTELAAVTAPVDDLQ
jgi:hypothetical protein